MITRRRSLDATELVPWACGLFLSAALFSHTVALRLALLLAGTLLAAGALWARRGTVQALPSLWLPFALWAGWAALSLLWTQEAERTAKELRNEVLYAALALWMCYIGAQARNAYRVVVPLVAAAAVAVCAVAVYSFFKGQDAYTSGWHGGPGNHSSALITLVACALGVLWYARQSAPPRTLFWLFAGLLVLLFAAAYTTLNRTIWIAFALQLALVAALDLRRPALTRGRRAGVVVAAGISLLFAGAAGLVVKVQKARGLSETSQVMVNDPRYSVWPVALQTIAEKPLTGYGFGRGIQRETLRDESGHTVLWHAHNLVLELALQIGLPGALLFFVLLAALAREGWRAARSPDRVVAACGLALLAMLVGMLIRNMTDMLFVRQNALLFWGLAGALLGWMQPARTPVAR